MQARPDGGKSYTKFGVNACFLIKGTHRPIDKAYLRSGTAVKSLCLYAAVSQHWSNMLEDNSANRRWGCGSGHLFIDNLTDGHNELGVKATSFSAIIPRLSRMTMNFLPAIRLTVVYNF